MQTMKSWHQMTRDERKLANEQTERELNAMRDEKEDEWRRFERRMPKPCRHGKTEWEHCGPCELT